MGEAIAGAGMSAGREASQMETDLPETFSWYKLLWF
jgi:hypothetical protein